jgi:hypothetical protein
MQLRRGGGLNRNASSLEGSGRAAARVVAIVSVASMAPVAPVASRRPVAGLLGAGRRVLASLSGRKALYDPIPGKHPTIDREVPAHHEGPHGCVLLGQVVRFVCKICLVLASIDQDQARVSIGVTVALV